MGTFGAGAWAGAALWNPAAVREKRVGGRGEEINPMREQSSSGSAAELKSPAPLYPPSPRGPVPRALGLPAPIWPFGDWKLRIAIGIWEDLAG